MSLFPARVRALHTFAGTLAQRGRGCQYGATRVEKTAKEQQEFLNALDNLGHVPTKTELRNCLGWDSTKFPRVYDQLKLGKLIEEIEIETDIANGAKRQAIGVRRLLQN